MLRRFIPIFHGGLLALLAVAILSPRAEARAFHPETFTLSNGLQVMAIPNPRSAVVSHMIWYKFGGGDERPGKSGTAHFLEHLMFKGTPTVPDGQLTRRVRSWGGNDNAFTTHDATAFYQNVPRTRLDEVMAMEADRMKNLTLRDEQVAAERQVIIEERKQRIDNTPQARFQEQLRSALFINHPYGTPVIGWLHEMRELTQDDALTSYRQWYAPNNAVVVVTGDITAEALRPLAEKYYGVVPASAVPPRMRPRAAPVVADMRLLLEDERVGQALLTKVYRVPRGSDALEMVAEALGGSPAARLYKTLVLDKKLAVETGVDYDPVSLNDTTFLIYATPAPGVSLAELETTLEEEIRRAADGGLTPEELRAAKNRKKAGRIYYLDSLQGPALLFGRAVASGFSVDWVEKWEERVERLSVEDTARAAASALGKDARPVTGLLMPSAKKPQRPAP